LSKWSKGTKSSHVEKGGGGGGLETIFERQNPTILERKEFTKNKEKEKEQREVFEVAKWGKKSERGLWAEKGLCSRT